MELSHVLWYQRQAQHTLIISLKATANLLSKFSKTGFPVVEKMLSGLPPYTARRS